MKMVTPMTVAESLDIPYKSVLKLLKFGILPGVKTQNRWFIPFVEFQKFKSRNADRIKKLKSDYVRMYFEGFTVKQLQARTSGEFYARNIFAPQKGFAEQTIYDAVKHGF